MINWFDFNGISHFNNAMHEYNVPYISLKNNIFFHFL